MKKERLFGYPVIRNDNVPKHVIKFGRPEHCPTCGSPDKDSKFQLTRDAQARTGQRSCNDAWHATPQEDK